MSTTPQFVYVYPMPQEQLLKGPVNFSTWKIGFQRRMMELKLWSYINGTATLAKQTTAAQISEFNENDQAALSNLILALEPDLYSMVCYCLSSHEAWRKLIAAFEKTGAEHALMIENQMKQLKFADCTNMYDFLQKMSLFRRQLRIAGSNLTEKDLILSLYLKLPEKKYYNLLTVLLTRTDFPTFDVVYYKLIQEEARYQAGKLEQPSTSNRDHVLCSKTYGGNFIKNFQGSNGGGFNNSYHRPNTNNPHQNLECHRCQKKGHISKNCRVTLNNYD